VLADIGSEGEVSPSVLEIEKKYKLILMCIDKKRKRLTDRDVIHLGESGVKPKPLAEQPILLLEFVLLLLVDASIPLIHTAKIKEIHIGYETDK